MNAWSNGFIIFCRYREQHKIDHKVSDVPRHYFERSNSAPLDL
jgi:hypothetical protein